MDRVDGRCRSWLPLLLKAVPAAHSSVVEDMERMLEPFALAHLPPRLVALGGHAGEFALQFAGEVGIDHRLLAFTPRCLVRPRCVVHGFASFAWRIAAKTSAVASIALYSASLFPPCHLRVSDSRPNRIAA
jgi:hypothetical protein